MTTPVALRHLCAGEFFELDRALHTDAIYGVDFSSDGTRLVTAAGDRTAVVWQRDAPSAPFPLLPDGRPSRARGWAAIARVEVPRDAACAATDYCYMSNAKFHPRRNDVVVTASGNKRTSGEVIVWTAPPAASGCAGGAGGGADSSADSGVDGGSIGVVWTKQVFSDPQMRRSDGSATAHAQTTTSVGWSPDGLLIVSGSADASVAVWDAISGDLRARIAVRFSLAVAGCLFFSRSLFVWHARASYCHAHPLAHTHTLRCMRCTPHLTHRRVVLPHRLRASTVRCQSHTRSVRDASFSPDGARFASVCDGGKLVLYSTDTMMPVSVHARHTSRCFSLSWSHDSTMVVTAGLEDKATVTDAATGAVLVTMSGQGCKSINCVR